MTRLLLIALLALSWPAEGAQKRDPKVRAAYQRLVPCPVPEVRIRPGTAGGRRGACPGFEIDHMQALVCGGGDVLENLQWLSVELHRLKTKEDLKCRHNRKAGLNDHP